MSVHYGTVTHIETSTGNVRIEDTWFTIADTDRKLYANVQAGDRVSFRTDVYGFLLQLDVVRAGPPDA